MYKVMVMVMVMLMLVDDGDRYVVSSVIASTFFYCFWLSIPSMKA